MGPFRDGWTPAEIEAVLARGDLEALVYVPIVVSMDPPEGDWAERICLSLVRHPDPTVRGNAVLGFGHLARIRGELDLAAVLPVVASALRDPHAWVRGQADAAAGDILHFLGVRVDGYDPGDED